MDLQLEKLFSSGLLHEGWDPVLFCIFAIDYLILAGACLFIAFLVWKGGTYEGDKRAALFSQTLCGVLALLGLSSIIRLFIAGPMSQSIEVGVSVLLAFSALLASHAAHSRWRESTIENKDEAVQGSATKGSGAEGQESVASGAKGSLIDEDVRYLAAIVESSDDGIVSMNPSGIIRSWNRGAEKLYGYSTEEVIGTSFKLIVPDESLEEYDEMYNTACGGAPVRHNETIHLRKDGTRVDVSVTMSPVLGGNGETLGLSCIARDITREKRARERLRTARDHAVQASNFKSEFLASMSHEIRTPLNAIIGLSDLLARSSLNTEQKSLTKTIVASGNVLLDLINDILDHSKLEAHKLELEVLEFEAVSVIEEAAEILASKARDKGLALMTYVHPDVPRVLRGDPGRIRQILINLIDNAIKFTESGEVVVRADFKDTTDSAMMLEISITDTGIGINDKVQEKLFSPFRQASAEITRTYGGTGLGLSISQKLVELMGGEIGVSSHPGQGSTFWFTLPFETSIWNFESKEVPEIKILKVLIVDGPPGSTRILKEYLSFWGLTCDSVSTWEAAESRLSERKYDIVFVDHDVPGVTIDSIRQEVESSRTKFVLLTSSNSSTIGESAFGAGYSACLVRPIKQSQLVDCLANLSGSRDLSNSSIQAETPSEPLTSGNRANSGLILVVEDNPVNQKVALLQLRDLGLAAHAVGNGKEALAATETTVYALILMDCQMPVMDGYETTKELRKREARTGRRTPIIAMTAHAMVGDREKCLAAGMDDYVSKPVNQLKLRRITDKWLNRDDIDSYIHPVLSIDKSKVRKADPKSTITIELTLLEKTYGKETTSEILNSFCNHMSDLLRALDRHLEKQNQRMVSSLLHDMKGMSSSVFATDLARFTYQAELLSREDDIDWYTLNIEIAKLRKLYGRIQNEIQSGETAANELD